jgi:hypothetical protein
MNKPHYVVADDVITYTSKRGDELQIDLDIPAEVLESALSADEEDDQAKQFDVVAAWLGADFEAAYNGMGVIERARFSRMFFEEFTKAVRTPLGESLRSSSTSGSTAPSSDGISESSSDAP